MFDFFQQTYYPPLSPFSISASRVLSKPALVLSSALEACSPDRAVYIRVQFGAYAPPNRPPSLNGELVFCGIYSVCADINFQYALPQAIATRPHALNNAEPLRQGGRGVSLLGREAGLEIRAVQRCSSAPTRMEATVPQRDANMALPISHQMEP